VVNRGVEVAGGQPGDLVRGVEVVARLDDPARTNSRLASSIDKGSVFQNHATCSALREENAQCINAFLGIPGRPPGAYRGPLGPGYRRRPGKSRRMDGFFYYGLLQKAEAA
jgi:hypothetical protein